MDEYVASKRWVAFNFQEIFAFSRKNNIPKISYEISGNDEHLLRKAYLLAKSVPRQSNRSKWREQSGYKPNMLTETVRRWVLCKDDLVCYHSAASRDMMCLIIPQKVGLDDS